MPPFFNRQKIKLAGSSLPVRPLKGDTKLPAAGWHSAQFRVYFAHAGDTGTDPRNESTRATGRAPSALARGAALSRFAGADCRTDFDCFQRLPLMAKREMRNDFPRKFSAGKPVARIVAGKTSGRTGTHLRHFGGTAAGDFRPRLVERAGRTRAAAERSCRPRSWTNIPSPPRHHHLARRATA